MRLWRTPLGRALLLGVALGTAGALIGLVVAASRNAELSSGVAWGLYVAGGGLLVFGASPSISWAPPPAVLVSMPEGAKEQVMQRQRDRIKNAPWMLLNFLVAAALIGIGALFEIYG
jgi:hypothetical protein